MTIHDMLRGVYGGKVYKQGVEYHITTSLALKMMQFDALASDLPVEPLQTQCDESKNT